MQLMILLWVILLCTYEVTHIVSADHSAKVSNLNNDDEPINNVKRSQSSLDEEEEAREKRLGTYYYYP